MDLRVAIFTFSTDSKIFCCSCEGQKSCGFGRKLFSPVSKECIQANFVNKFIMKIKENNNFRLPDIIVINLQDSSIVNPEKKLRSDQLLGTFDDCIGRHDANYAFHKQKISGVGENGSCGLRTGVFINNNLKYEYNFNMYRSSKQSDNDSNTSNYFVSGAILLNVVLNKNNKKFNVHFFNTHMKQKKDSTGKELVNIMRKLKNGMKNSHNADCFVVGNLGFGMDFGEKYDKKQEYLGIMQRLYDNPVNEIRRYIKYDTLTKAIYQDLQGFHEGISNDGPIFLPTYCLMKDTSIEPFETRKYNMTVVPTWADRIIYSGHVSCILYDSFDSDTTANSDHMPVIGLFNVQPPSF